jgi:hypothetical protein
VLRRPRMRGRDLVLRAHYTLQVINETIRQAGVPESGPRDRAGLRPAWAEMGLVHMREFSAEPR